MDHLLNEFACSIAQITGTMEAITHIEEQKAAAASERRHSAMDGLLQQEQAAILKLRGLELRRLSLAQELGWKDLTFRQILSIGSEEQKTLLEPLFQKLQEQFRQLQDAKDSAGRIIRVRLSEFQQFLDQTGSSYDRDGNPVVPGSPSFHDTYV